MVASAVPNSTREVSRKVPKPLPVRLTTTPGRPLPGETVSRRGAVATSNSRKTGVEFIGRSLTLMLPEASWVAPGTAEAAPVSRSTWKGLR